MKRARGESPVCVHCGDGAAFTLSCDCEQIPLCSDCIAHNLECECPRLVLDRVGSIRCEGEA